MTKKVKRLPGSEDHILGMLSRYHQVSKDYVNKKRDIMVSDVQRYNKGRDGSLDVRSKLLYDTMKVFTNVHYTDTPIIDFDYDDLQGKVKSENLRKLWEHDIAIMEPDERKFIRVFETGFYGVSIDLYVGYNKKLNVPIVESIPATVWLPDPMAGLSHDSFRYHGFERVDTVKNLVRRGFSKKKLKQMEVDMASETYTDRMQMDEAKGYTNQAYREHDKSMFSENPDKVDVNDMVSYIDWLVCLEDGKYMISTDSKCGCILRWHKIAPIFQEEKDDPSKIMFPVAVTRFSPQRNDPLSLSLCDLVRDVDHTMDGFLKLQKQIEASRLFPMTAYNKRLIKDRRELDFKMNGLIAVDGPVSGAIAPLAKDLGTNGSVQAFKQELSHGAHRSAGADDLQMGVQGTTGRTKHEFQQVQTNANLNSISTSRIMQWGARRRVQLWARFQCEFMGNKDQKIIKVDYGNGVGQRVLRKKDFATKYMPHVKIVSKSEQEAKRQDDLLIHMQDEASIMANPMVPEVSKLFYIRKKHEYQGKSKEEIEIYTPKTATELIIERENEILNYGKNIPVKPEDDDAAHIALHKQSIDGPAKIAHIKAHEIQLIMKQKKAQMNPPGMGMEQGGPNGAPAGAPGATIPGGDQRNDAMQNQTQAQLTNNLVQQTNTDVLNPQPV